MSPLKKCAVCGDKALGYNFNAVTCESCKAFFRRNALAKKQFTCPFNQNCDITVVTRRFCQRCRLKKCLDIGMKSENIMSEEDKMIKRRKIESNREKRRQTDNGTKETRPSKSNDIKQEQQNVADSSSGFDAYASYDSQSSGSFDSGTGQGSSGGAVASSSNVLPSESPREVNLNAMSSEEMVEYIVCDPDRACQAISKLMRTPKEALSSIEKIINSQKDALRLIEHLIAYPGDALKIISKLMNSPFNALSVFTKFMSSPTDALEIISKIVSSPQDVLLFIKNLMDSPEDAIDIMNKFMNTPAEALRIINKIFNGSSVAEAQDEKQTTNDVTTKDLTVPAEEENTLLNSMLSNSPNTSHTDNMMQVPSTSKLPESFVSTPSQTTTLDSPISASPSESCEYQSPTTTNIPHDVGVISTSPIHITSAVNEFASEHFDLKTAAIHSQANNFAFIDNYDTINSLDNVLSEVIRIEFQAFNDLPPECVKQEYQTPLTSFTTSHLHHQQESYGCGADQQQHLTGNQLRSPSQNPQICAPSSALMSRDLNDTELMKLRELRLASEALYYPVDNDLTTLMMGDSRIKPEDTQQDPKLLNLINLTAVAIKRLIKMAKKIKAFRDMCQEDQVALLKGGCTEMMIMRSVMSYDGNRNTWKIPHTKEDMSNIRAEILKLAKGNLYEEHLKFIRTFDEKWRMDENIILIMCAIVLFMPTRSRIIHSDVIRLEQNSYYYLLRRYLESVYPGCEARSTFIKLIQKISDVERLNHVIIGVYLNVNPAQIEPLLREIFDLKNH